MDNTRKEGSPGYDKESAFNYLLHMEDRIHSHRWLSEHSKTKFDFAVHFNSIKYPSCFDDDKTILIDVVSCKFQYRSYRLNTNHKNFYELTNYAYEMEAKACYLAFCKPYTDIWNTKNWMFLRIHKEMPYGDIYISKARAHGLKTWRYIFSDKRPIKTIMQEKCKAKYKLRKKKEEEVMKWIYE